MGIGLEFQDSIIVELNVNIFYLIYCFNSDWMLGFFFFSVLLLFVCLFLVP